MTRSNSKLPFWLTGEPTARLACCVCSASMRGCFMRVAVVGGGCPSVAAMVASGEEKESSTAPVCECCAIAESYKSRVKGSRYDRW